MHPPFRHSSVEFEWPCQSRPSMIGRNSSGQSFSLWLTPLPQCAFLPHDLWVKIPFHGKPADFDKLYDNRQAGNRAVIFDVGKIAPVDIDLFRQRLTR